MCQCFSQCVILQYELLFDMAVCVTLISFITGLIEKYFTFNPRHFKNLILIFFFCFFCFVFQYMVLGTSGNGRMTQYSASNSTNKLVRYFDVKEPMSGRVIEVLSGCYSYQ
jgi:hypothetical protein